jgi:hypothetical protein
MKFLATVLTAVLGAGVLWMAGTASAADDAAPAPAPVTSQVAAPLPASLPAPAAANTGLNAPAQPGNDAEARNYEQRQSESPEAQEFTGGHVIVLFGAGLVFLALVALIVILILQHENKI